MLFLYLMHNLKKLFQINETKNMQSMESKSTIPDRKLLARLVLVREEARNMMGGGLLDERNDRGLSTLPEAEVFLSLPPSLPPSLASSL